MKNFLNSFKKLNVYLQSDFEVDFRSVAKMLSELVDADILVAKNKNEIVGGWPEVFGNTLPEEYLPLISKNILDHIMVCNKCCAAVPILSCDDVFMIIAVSRETGKVFDDEQIMLLENMAAVLGLKINYKAEAERRKAALQKAKIKAVLNVLSYSELQAAIHILGELEGKTEGILIASKIADSAGLTRSVVVNALRKFQSGTLIESKSLGMKGTFIRILYPLLLDEIKNNIM